jgi:hypothetical protein
MYRITQDSLSSPKKENPPLSPRAASLQDLVDWGIGLFGKRNSNPPYIPLYKRGKERDLTQGQKIE